MKRRISLYIGNKPADLSTDSLVQMNYTAEDLSDPAIVKNSYSQHVTLPATRNNDAIFGGMFRADRRTVSGDGSTGASFSPLVRTPFTIYDEAGELLESGYMKLDSITAKDGSPAYVITLYGGLGSFFYTLSYDDEGNEMTLGDLPLLDGGNVGFTINKETVAAAWAALRAGTAGQWQVVNFAPAYNGFPDGDFDADKAVGKPSDFGNTDFMTIDGEIYRTINNNALFDLGDDFTEWQTKDLRSYLQRPVVSVKGILDGIARYAASKGFTLELDPAFFTSINPSYSKAWMTLPLLSTKDRLEEAEDVALSGNAITDDTIVGKSGFPATSRMSPALNVPDVSVTVSVKVHPAVAMESSQWSGNKFILNRGLTIAGTTNGNEGTVVFAQLRLLDSSGKVVSASPLKVFMTNSLYKEHSAADLVSASGIPYESQYGVDPTIAYEQLSYRTSTLVNLYWWQMPSGAVLEATGVGIARAEVRVFASVLDIVNSNYQFQTLKEFQAYVLSLDGSLSVRQTLKGWGATITDAKAIYDAASGYRSNSAISQNVLFGDTMTPAAFMLSYSKLFGLSYFYDKGAKTVKLLTRNALYDGEVVDLQTRIDRSKEIKTTPAVATAKWLSFSAGEPEGEFADFYRDKYGREYGVQKVNTGYDFNADTKDVLESVEFKGGAEVLEKSVYFINPTLSGGKKLPSPFMNGNAAYRLYLNGDVNTSEEINITPPSGSNVTISYFDADMPSYDILPKLQCHGNDNGATDGNNVLLFHRGFIAYDSKITAAYARFIITDDSSEMYRLNEGPCWELSKGLAAADMPIFGRHWLDGSEIVYSMDFGVPAEFDIPFVTVAEDAAMYPRYWKKYIEDRYNVDTRVRSAYVDFRGVQVGEHLLRKFYFADNAIWVLNKISNYSLTGAGTTQCEFVKVQDRKAYTEGQLSISYFLRLNGEDADQSNTDVPADGTTITYSVQSNGTPYIVSYDSRLTVSLNSEANTWELSIYVPENTSDAELDYNPVILGIRGADHVRREISISQKGQEYYLMINGHSSDFSIDATADGEVIKLTCATYGTPRIQRFEGDAIDSVDIQGGIISIATILNQSAVSREAIVVVELEEDPAISITVTVKQASALIPSIAFSPGLQWSSSDQTVTIINNGNVPLSIVSVPSFISDDGLPISLAPGAKTTRRISANNTGIKRLGDISMEYSDALGQIKTYKVSVIQKA